MWSNLESIFSSPEIMTQMPQEFRRFALVDKKWVQLMHKSGETQKVIQICLGEEGPLEMLAYCKEQLERCQKSLGGMRLLSNGAFCM